MATAWFRSAMQVDGLLPRVLIPVFWDIARRSTPLASLWSTGALGHPEVLADVRRIAGAGARLVRFDGVERFDVLPLLVATDGAIEAFGQDSRRLRPNIVVGGVEGLAERTWPGRRLRIGEAIIQVQDLRARCVMTTFDPDTLAPSPQVLRDIVKRFDGKLALNCDVLKGGIIRVGQEVELLAAPETMHA